MPDPSLGAVEVGGSEAAAVAVAVGETVGGAVADGEAVGSDGGVGVAIGADTTRLALAVLPVPAFAELTAPPRVV